MASFRKRGRVWFFRYFDASGVRHERKGCPDRRATEAMAASLETEAAQIKAGLIDPKALGFRAHENRPLADHLADWRGGMLAAGKGPRHAGQFHTRAARVVALTRGARLADIDPGERTPEARARAALALADALGGARLSDLAPGPIQAALARLRTAGKSHQTLNHYRAAVRAFARWARDNGRLRDDPMRGVSGLNVESDRRRVRRALTPEEAGRLIQAADRGPTVKGLTGPDRARLYALALGTGFRAAELGSLTPERFDLAANPPVVSVAAAYAKNRREAVQPLSDALAERLAPWIASLPPGRPVFHLPGRTAEMLRVDLVAAGIPDETPSGVCDFHSLRATFITHLANSGASVKTTQTLARHSTPTLTFGVYAKASLHDVAGAVNALPDLPPGLTPAPKTEAKAATGTDGRRINNHLAPHLPHSGDGSGRFGSEPGDPEPEGEGERNPLDCRELSLAGGLRRGEAPPGFEPGMEVLQTSALPLGYGAVRDLEWSILPPREGARQE